PAGDARDREDGRVHVGGEAQHAVDGGAEEVDVRPDLLAALLHLALHHALHLQAHLEPLAVARLLGQPAADLLEDLGARVEDPVDAVPEAHHAAAGPRQDALDVRLDALDAPDLLEGLHHGLVGTAVQRALERAGGGRDRAVDVGEGAGGGAGDEGAGVRAVLGVEDEGDVHHVRRGLRGLLAGEHVEEVAGHAQVGVGCDRLQALPGALDPGDDRRELRQQQPADALDVVEVDAVGRLVEGAEQRHGRPEGVHGADVARQRAEQVRHGGGHLEGPPQLGPERLELGPGGQLALPQEVDDLLVARLVRQLPDVVAAVDQLALGAVYEADRADVDVDAV